jgi:MFS family permease
VIASAAGGYLAEHYSWRTALFVAGMPGLLAALLLFTTVAEPHRGSMEGADSEGRLPRARFPEVLVFLGRNPALILLIAGCAMLGLISISIGTWAASFFIRVHGMDLAEVGLLIGIFGGLGGVVAPAVYGRVGDILAKRDAAWPLRLVWLSAVLALGAGMVMLFSDSLVFAIIGYGVGEFLRSGYPPPAYSTLLDRTPAHMRGTVTSILQFASVLIGFGLGPVLIGALSDYYGGGAMIRYALATGLLVFVPVTILIWLSSWLLFGRQSAALTKREDEKPSLQA